MKLVKISLALVVAASAGVMTTLGLWAHDPEEKAADRQHDEQSGAELSAQTAWSTIQKSVKDMETAVTSKNLKGIHPATVEIMPAIKALQAHCRMLAGDVGLRLESSLKALRSAVIEFHHERNDGVQARAEAQLTKVQAAFREVESQNPESLFNLRSTNQQKRNTQVPINQNQERFAKPTSARNSRKFRRPMGVTQIFNE